jgi:hypothetical protein
MNVGQVDRDAFYLRAAKTNMVSLAVGSIALYPECTETSANPAFASMSRISLRKYRFS